MYGWIYVAQQTDASTRIQACCVPIAQVCHDDSPVSASVFQSRDAKINI